MDSHDLEQGDAGRAFQHALERGFGERQRVSAREDELADFGVLGEVIERGIEATIIKQALALVEVRFAKAEAAVDGAKSREVKDRPVAVTVSEARGGQFFDVADRVAAPGTGRE